MAEIELQKLLVLVTGLQGTGKSTMATVAAETLGAPVLGHDWAMSGLRPYPELQTALDAMEPPGHRAVGWSILSALARSQFRRGCSVVLDGVAREPEISACRVLASDEGAQFVLVMTQCADVDLHRSRVTGRQRQIPNWYELDWGHVQRARRDWQSPQGVDLILDAGGPLDENAERLRTLFNAFGPNGA